MSQTVVGVFQTRVQAERARQELIGQGFAESEVRVQSNPSDVDDGAASTSSRSAAPEDEGFMAGVGRFFSDLFGGDGADDAGNYAEAVRRGSAVVALQVADESRAREAQRALAAAGAVDIDTMAASWRQEGYGSFDVNARPYTAEQITAERGKVLPVVQEELEVGKREVDLGTVRVYSRTVETPVNETVQLREQHADIERRQVDRPATETDLQAFQGGSVEVRETAERAVVSKTARVVEEVVVGTATTTSEQTIDDRVRSTVVEVDRGQDNGRGTAAGPTGSTADLTGSTGSSAGTAALAGGTGSLGSTAAGGSAMEQSTEPGISPAGGPGIGGSRSVLANDALFRSHFQQNYASGGDSYDTYAPAYAYGSTLRGDQRYAGSDWSTVEADAQRDWQSRHPETAWEKVKSAVRHGWDSMTR